MSNRMDKCTTKAITAWNTRQETKSLTVERIEVILECAHIDNMDDVGGHKERTVTALAKAIHAALPTPDEKDRRIAELEHHYKFLEESFKPIMQQLESAESKIARAINTLLLAKNDPDMGEFTLAIIKILEDNDA